MVAAGVCLAAAPSDAGANIFQQVCCHQHGLAHNVPHTLVSKLMHVIAMLLFSLVLVVQESSIANICSRAGLYANRQTSSATCFLSNHVLT